MSVSILTTKGRTTIPKDMRERLRLRSGDKMDWVVEDDGTIRVVPRRKKPSEGCGFLASRIRKKSPERRTK